MSSWTYVWLSSQKHRMLFQRTYVQCQDHNYGQLQSQGIQHPFWHQLALRTGRRQRWRQNTQQNKKLKKDGDRPGKVLQEKARVSAVRRYLIVQFGPLTSYSSGAQLLFLFFQQIGNHDQVMFLILSFECPGFEMPALNSSPLGLFVVTQTQP